MTRATAGSSPTSWAPDAEGGLEPWGGVRAVWAFGSPEARHGVDTTESFDQGVASLAAHAAYIEGLGWENWDPREFLEGFGRQSGQRLGVAFATTAEVYRSPGAGTTRTDQVAADAAGRRAACPERGEPMLAGERSVTAAPGIGAGEFRRCQPADGAPADGDEIPQQLAAHTSRTVMNSTARRIVTSCRHGLAASALAGTGPAAVAGKPPAVAAPRSR